MAADAPAGGNVLTRRIGPLPTWAWVSVIAAVILAWAWYARSKAGQAAPAGNAAVTPPTVEQFYLTTPPEQEEPEEDGEGPERHHRHRRRRRRPRGRLSPAKAGGGGTGPPTRRPRQRQGAA